VAPPYKQANFTNENFPGSSQTQDTAINNFGSLAGFFADSNGATAPNFIGFVDKGGTFTAVEDPSTPAIPSSVNQLLGVNDNNVAAGFYQDALGNLHGYTYNIGTASFDNLSLPSGDDASTFAATGINNAGDVVGFFTNAGGTTEGFIDNGGIFTNFLAAGSNNTMFLGINNEGEAVGVYQDGSGQNHGFVYSIATGTYQTVDDPNAVLANGGTTINGINDNGDLVGFYGDANGNTIGLLANPVPEPRFISVLLLAALAFAGIQQTRREKARTQI
jgi:probable HAF family extracellular repeat protein